MIWQVNHSVLQKFEKNTYLILLSTNRVNVGVASYREFSIWALSKQLRDLSNLNIAPFCIGGNCGSESFRFTVTELELESNCSCIRSCSLPLCHTPSAPRDFPSPHPIKIISYFNLVLFLITSRDLDVLKIKNFISFRVGGDDQLRLIGEESSCGLVEILGSKEL